MAASKKISLRRLYTGGIAWTLSAQYFLVEAVVKKAWLLPPYSNHYNVISDLGATTCLAMPFIPGWFACSPLHTLMNISFVVSGLLTLIGIYFLRRVFPSTWFTRLGFWFLGIGALGVIAVGLFPENQQPIVHLIGALTLLVFSNVGIILLGSSLYHTAIWRRLGAFSLILGAVGLFAFVLLPLGMIPTIGVGMMERISAYPITIWLTFVGIYFLVEYKRSDLTVENIAAAKRIEY